MFFKLPKKKKIKVDNHLELIDFIKYEIKPKSIIQFNCGDGSILKNISEVTNTSILGVDSKNNKMKNLVKNLTHHQYLQWDYKRTISFNYKFDLSILFYTFLTDVSINRAILVNMVVNSKKTLLIIDNKLKKMTCNNVIIESGLISFFEKNNLFLKQYNIIGDKIWLQFSCDENEEAKPNYMHLSEIYKSNINKKAV